MIGLRILLYKLFKKYRDFINDKCRTDKKRIESKLYKF